MNKPSHFKFPFDEFISEDNISPLMPKNITHYTVRIINVPEQLSGKIVELTVLYSLNAVSDLLGPLYFKIVDDTNDSDFKIIFCDNDGPVNPPYPFQENTLAYAFKPWSDRAGEVYINTAKAIDYYLDDNVVGYDLSRVLTHELLHSFGLDHSDNPNDVMYKSYTDDVVPVFSKDTRDFLLKHYGTIQLRAALHHIKSIR